MPPQTLNSYNSTMAYVTENFEINVFLKNILGAYLNKYFWEKKGVFGDL